MAGAWEISNKSVLCGILSVEQVTMAWAQGFRKLIVPGHTVAVTGMPFCHARNALCQRALDMGVSHLFFLDSDVIPPPDTILRLLNYNVPIISGVYCRRSPPHGIPVMLKNGQWLTRIPNQGVIEVDYVGAGCLLIDTNVLRTLPPIAPEIGKAWFDWRVDRASVLPPGEALSEDFAFCLHARKHGCKIFVDCGIRAKHVGLAQSDYHSFVPAEIN